MKDYLKEKIEQALSKLTDTSDLPPVIIEKPRQPEHGDAAVSIAMQLARVLKKNPRAIAEDLVNVLDLDTEKITSTEIAGPGFINFRYADNWLFNQLKEIREKGDQFGATTSNAGQKVLVEFVSANPTGPLTVGHGRNAVLGDTLARLYEWTGAEVDREYYFNNAGRQMRILGQSVASRYAEQIGRSGYEFPEGGYEGEYIRDIATKLHNDFGDGLLETRPPEFFKEAAEQSIFEDIRTTLERMKIEMDSFFNEHTLYESNAVFDVVDKLREKKLAYDADGAIWFKTTEFGKEKDTVLIKSTGEPTYRLPDIAYHANKLDRGYDICVDVFGADHIATYPDVMNGIAALGYDKEKVEVLVYQFVTIVKDGKPFKMSTRKANFITLDELMDEVGSDVTRFFFLMRSPGTHLEFDIAQAKEAGEKNPVFYLQYAHARIKSIWRKVGESLDVSKTGNYNLLTHESETALLKLLLTFPDAIEQAAQHKEPHRLITYLNDLAAGFHKFYHDCRIAGEEEELARARMQLLEAVAQVMANGLNILGINAPDSM